MIGLEVIFKAAPLVGLIIMGLTGYGEIKSDIKNLYILQQSQYSAIQSQLDNIQGQLNVNAKRN